MRIARHVRRLDGYVPGEQPKSRKVIKLNTNENPYPPSPACGKALKSFVAAGLRRYPDPECTALRAEIAKLHNTSIDRVFVGNGSDEILALSARAFVENDETIASLDPSYSLYKTLAAIRDVKWTARPDDNCALFLWTNPNAPTGEFADPARIAAFSKKFRGVLLVDEAYADFARENCMSLATARGNRNVIVMRTLSKSYSLAGLRVGYCIGPTELIAALVKVKDSYNIDAVAQAVALAAIKDQASMRRNAAKIIRTRTAFVRELTRRGWDILPSETNFVFAKPPRGKKAAAIFDSLRSQDIYVRYFPGRLTGDRLRITIGTDSQMKTLLKTLDEHPFKS